MTQGMSPNPQFKHPSTPPLHPSPPLNPRADTYDELAERIRTLGGTAAVVPAALGTGASVLASPLSPAEEGGGGGGGGGGGSGGYAGMSGHEIVAAVAGA